MIVPNLDILPARVSSDVYLGKVSTIEELCAIAGIAYRYTGGDLPYVGFSHGTGNLRAVDAQNHSVLVVDIEQFYAQNPPDQALRVIEILAHSFHEYAARECARGLFGFSGGVVSSRRPRQERAAMTAAQRKAKQRARASNTGICRVCVVQPARDDRTTCTSCATNHRRAQRKRRARKATEID